MLEYNQSNKSVTNSILNYKCDYRNTKIYLEKNKKNKKIHVIDNNAITMGVGNWKTGRKGREVSTQHTEVTGWSGGRGRVRQARECRT